jgi:hypothetical protein
MQHHAQNGRYTQQAGTQIEVDGHVYADKSEADSLSWPIFHIWMMTLKGNSIARFHGALHKHAPVDGRETCTIEEQPNRCRISPSGSSPPHRHDVLDMLGLS